MYVFPTSFVHKTNNTTGPMLRLGVCGLDFCYYAARAALFTKMFIIGFSLSCRSLVNQLFRARSIAWHSKRKKKVWLPTSSLAHTKNTDRSRNVLNSPPIVMVTGGFCALVIFVYFRICTKPTSLKLSTSTTKTTSRYIYMCVPIIKPFFLPVDIQHTQRPCRLFDPREIQALWSHTTTQRKYIVTQ